ncbi:carboxylate--amine ligase [Rhodococcus sp. WB1]|uniref:carboxylate-amine ligase n=1 Tax=Rhodococcus TaxID=1827 RepID=UPI00081A470B|nr:MULTISPECIES: glutamate--cysteine ligase [Rhodococcus]ANZ25309.1 carboxylate--amine ligase [Rhodococcus sp. WB1]MBC2587454.1 glutamate--cysteine ligase [Rhodococcus aetherivorans]MDV6291923.1 glutamate--cysteine ligase [Rhodococcus aetherivorans]UGQ43968.1 glutamate--cysteine ligase [Rhodococcus aetherivorans]
MTSTLPRRAGSDRGDVPGRLLTMGVEEELLLVDADSGRPRLSNAAVVADAREAGLDLQLELSRCQVETATPVCTRIDDLRQELRVSRTVAAAAAARAGSRLLAAAVPPFDTTPPGALTDAARYRRMAEHFGVVTDQVICGCHVHVGVPDRDVAVQVCNHLRPWLPALLALTANSSVTAGADTGYASWRHIQWGRWGSGGPPPFFRSARHYDDVVAMMLDAGTVLDPAMVYWDIRLSPHLPTLEIRVCDVPATIEETVTAATLVRGLVSTALTAVHRGDPAPRLEADRLKAACWRAAREGIDGYGMDPLTQRPVPAARLLGSLLEHVRPGLEEAGDFPSARASVRRILRRGNGARRQRRALAASRSTADFVAELARITVEGCEPAAPPPTAR